MMGVPINYLALIVAAVASMVVGYVYYSPWVLGKQWMKLSGIKDMKPKGSEMARVYGTSYVLSLITAYVLVFLMVTGMSFFHTSKLTAALMAAFWAWLGFVMPVQVTDWLFTKKPLQLVLINTGYQLLSLLAMGAVLAYL